MFLLIPHFRPWAILGNCFLLCEMTCASQIALFAFAVNKVAVIIEHFLVITWVEFLPNPQQVGESLWISSSFSFRRQLLRWFWQISIAISKWCQEIITSLSYEIILNKQNYCSSFSMQTISMMQHRNLLPQYLTIFEVEIFDTLCEL